jgi:hypothetical protein
MGLMKDLDIELHNAPNIIKYLYHKIKLLDTRLTDLEDGLIEGCVWWMRRQILKD